VTETKTCQWHPERETGLTCAQCGKAICVECMRQHPVGIRCKECSRKSRLPTYQISTAYLVRGVAATVGLGIAGGIALFMLDRTAGLGLFRMLLMLGLGYVVGEGISLAVNRRRGLLFQYMAAGAVVVALGISWLGTLLLDGFLPVNLFTLISAGIALAMAVNRLRP
jgi:hypothetical protein